MKKYLSVAIIVIATAATIATAHAQDGRPRASLDAPAPPASEECRQLQERIKELDRMDDERIARGGRVGAQQSPVQSREWISQQRKSAKDKMFFARC